MPDGGIEGLLLQDARRLQQILCRNGFRGKREKGAIQIDFAGVQGGGETGRSGEAAAD